MSLCKQSLSIKSKVQCRILLVSNAFSKFCQFIWDVYLYFSWGCYWWSRLCLTLRSSPQWSAQYYKKGLALCYSKLFFCNKRPKNVGLRLSFLFFYLITWVNLSKLVMIISQIIISPHSYKPQKDTKIVPMFFCSSFGEVCIQVFAPPFDSLLFLVFHTVFTFTSLSRKLKEN